MLSSWLLLLSLLTLSLKDCFLIDLIYSILALPWALGTEEVQPEGEKHDHPPPPPPWFPVAFFTPHWWWRKDPLGPHVIDKAMVRLRPLPASLAAVDKAFNAISGTLVLKLHSDTLVRLNHVTHLALAFCIVNSRWSQDHGRVNPKTSLLYPYLKWNHMDNCISSIHPWVLSSLPLIAVFRIMFSSLFWNKVASKCLR